jgi:hypothetical protein
MKKEWHSEGDSFAGEKRKKGKTVTDKQVLYLLVRHYRALASPCLHRAQHSITETCNFELGPLSNAIGGTE